jgi:hypothetical protein
MLFCYTPPAPTELKNGIPNIFQKVFDLLSIKKYCFVKQEDAARIQIPPLKKVENTLALSGIIQSNISGPVRISAEVIRIILYKFLPS